MRVPVLPLLGVGVDGRGATDAAQAHRAKEATGSWAKRRDLLRNRFLPERLRVEKLYETVFASATFGCGGWSLSSRLRRSLQALEGLYLRRLLAIRREPDQPWKDHVRQVARDVKRLKARYQVTPLWQMVVQRSHAFLGHVARAVLDRRPTLLSEALVFRDCQWWRARQALMVGRRHGKGEAVHAKNQGYKVPWERMVERHHGADWRELAGDRRGWFAARKDFAKFVLGLL